MKNSSLSILAFILSLLFNSCINSSKMPEETNIKNVYEMLKNTTYREISYFKSDKLDLIWENGKNENSLIKIIRDQSKTHTVQFLAAEVLFKKSPNFPQNGIKNDLANIYSKAIQNTVLPANAWGFMYHLEKNNMDGSGTLGKHLISIGEIAVPFLLSTLDNTEELSYEGSRDATLGNSLNYRVKDASAYYLSKITGIPIGFHENLSDRDAEIENFKKIIENEK